MVTEFFVITLPGYREIELLACVEVLTEAQAICGSISIHQVGLSSPDELWKAHALVDSRPGSAIALLGGAHPPAHFDHGLAKILRRAWRQDVTLCAIGPASIYLASLGLANGHWVTALPDAVEELRARHGLVRWRSDSTCTQDRNLVTSVGFLGAIEGTLVTLRCVGKTVVADRVASRLHMKVVKSCEGHGMDIHVHRLMHPAVKRAAEVLHRDPLQSWTTAAVAKIACVSERHLQRLFKTEFGCGVLDYVQRLRLQRAMTHFKAEPHLTIERVAQAAGFSSTQQLRRIWRKEHGQPPSVLRRRMLGATHETQSAGPEPVFES